MKMQQEAARAARAPQVGWGRCWAVILAVMLLAACGGGADRTKAQLRLVNASSGYAGLDLRVDDQLRQGAVAYGDAAAYVEADPGKPAAITSAGSPTSLLSFTPGLSARKYYTALAYGPLGALKQVLLDDNAGAPDTNRVLLRVVNAAPDAGSLDIYLTGTDESLAAAVPQQAAAAVDAVGSWLTVNSGSYRLRVTAAGSKTDLRLDLSGLALASRQVATLVLAPAAGGVLVKGLLLTQQGAITPLEAARARLRLVSGMAESGIVNSLRLGDTPVFANVTAPAVTGYVLVPAGTGTAVISVNGTPLASSVFNLSAGADYTLLVYGAPADAQRVLLRDDNTLPTDRSRAKMRLVNGVPGLTGALSLSVDFAPVASSVTTGTASTYTQIDATTTGRLSVTAAGTAAPLFDTIDQIFAAGANYSVFLVGSTTAPVGIVRKDR